jgi:hypothetical protein
VCIASKINKKVAMFSLKRGKRNSKGIRNEKLCL